MKNLWNGDVKLDSSTGEGAIVFSGGQPAMCDGLENAAYISLFTAPGWWGGEIGSEVETLARGNINDRTILEIEQAARDALAWMVSEGVAASVEVSTEVIGTYALGLIVIITEPDKYTPLTLRYQLNWEGTKLVMSQAT